MKRKIILTVAAVAVVAVSARAQVVIQTPAGQAYTIISNVPASAVTEVTYQWYRDNSPIPNATKESYTVPAAAAFGDNVQFYRMAKAQECAGEAEKKSNIVTVTFTGYVIPAGCNLIVAGLCWASYNVDDLYTFATRADIQTKHYQWNRLTAYSADDPLTPAWNSAVDTSTMWKVNPCPPNWRVPSPEEYQQLLNVGYTFADANTRGNQYSGYFCGHNHTTCKLPNSMSGCVFFPESGYRTVDGTLSYRNMNGSYWTSSMQLSSSSGYRFYMYDSVDGIGINNVHKAYALPIRCVQ